LLKIDILTLFPNMFEGFINESIIKRAIEKKLVEINIIDFREFSEDKNKKVDDYPYGGGNGMVLACQPIFDAVESIKTENSIVIMTTPSGTPLKQKISQNLSNKQHLIIICGHYEGFDERIRTIVDLEISIGDYVLTGGELPAMVITDSITRLVDGVIKEESRTLESFNDNLLDYPEYTKPQNFRGLEVPEVLLSGHHKNIEEFRKEEALKRTKSVRPDLLKEE